MFRSSQHRHRPAPWTRTAAFAAVTLTAGLAAHAQVLYGTLTGTVTDATGAVIPNAHVQATETGTGVVHTGVSNAEGVYLFTDLNAGTYQVTITAPGFTASQQTGITLLTNTVARVNVQLTAGTSQTVEVTTAAPLLETDRAETSYNISPQQIAELPTTSTTGRNFQSLYRLIPGSTPPAEQNSAGGNPQRSQAVNVNGISSVTNTTRIDGAIDAYPWLPYLAAYLPPTDGIQSINAVTGSYNAEQGSAGGSAINVTIKSGTNQFHGSVWAYNTIAQFNAQAWQNRTGIRQKNILNEDGGSFGGPIIRDKLFFFGDYDRITVDKAINGTLSVPTAAMRGGDFGAFVTALTAQGLTCNSPGLTAAQLTGCIFDPATGSATGVGRTAFAGNVIPSARLSQAAKVLLQKLPAPTSAGLSNNYFGSSTNAFERQNADIKVTYVPTQKTSYFGRYSLSPNNITDPQVFGPNPGGGTYDGGQPGAATGLVQNVGLGFTHAFTANLLMDANAGYTRQRLGATSPDLTLGDYGVNQLGIPGTNNNGSYLYGGIPAFYFNTYASLGNANSGSPFTFKDNQYTGNVNLTYVKGTHSMRFGGEYIHAAINHVQPGSGNYATPRGSFVFSGGATTTTLANGTSTSAGSDNSFAAFLLGQPENYQKGVQTFNPEAIRTSQFAFYAQDTWQATKQLVLNYGVRYEYYPLPVSAHFGTSRYDPSVRSTITVANVTYNVGTELIGGEGGLNQHANTTNGPGQIVPRLGISYQVDPKTVIRSGFGISVDPDSLRSLVQAYPSTVTANVSGANALLPATSLNAGLLSPTTSVGIAPITLPSITSGYLPLAPNLSTVTIPQNFRRGYIESYNLSVQRDLGLGLVTNIAYVGTHSIRQQVSVNINAAPIGGGAAGRLLNTTYGANTNNSDINSLLPFQGSVYNSLQTQLSKNGSHASTGIIYTYSKAMDVADNSAQSGLTFAYPAYQARNWALAGYDRTHNFQWWTTYPFPFGHDGLFLRSGFAGYVLGNWRVSTILSRASGTPLTVTASGGSLNAPGNTQVADQNYGAQTVLQGRTANPNNVNGYQYINPAAFQVVTTARFGTAGRNDVRGPGLFDLDVSLKRDFPIFSERYKLQFVADAFDVTNTPQFANPSTVTTTANAFGATPAATANGFGVITTSNANRTLRLSGRISF